MPKDLFQKGYWELKISLIFSSLLVMYLSTRFFYLFILLTSLFCCSESKDTKLILGIEKTEEYLPYLKDKNVAIVANQTSIFPNGIHLVDSLLSLKIKVKKVFCPEHGFRGIADAGEKINDSIDTKTGLPLISLYGKKKKPLPDDLKNIDIVIYDIQDIGVRFFTYISTMHYVMEACAENKIKMIILDRPNPNGFYVDGPVLVDKKFKSFIGLDPIPVVYGMTCGELAKMINGEGWLNKKVKCDLSIIKMKNYKHNMHYSLPVAPSPNLKTMSAIYLYPSLAFFEGTVISVGRGTDKAFQIFGHPQFKDMPYVFIPHSMQGAKNPKYLGQKCYGYDLTEFGNTFIKNSGKIYLFWLLEAYKKFDNKKKFFKKSFDFLAGNSTFRKQIIQGKTEEEIRKSWQKELNDFKKKEKNI